MGLLNHTYSDAKYTAEEVAGLDDEARVLVDDVRNANLDYISDICEAYLQVYYCTTLVQGCFDRGIEGVPLNDNRTLCTSSCDEFQIKVNQDCFFDNPPDLECSNTDLFID